VRDLVRKEMKRARRIGTSLIYPPAFYARPRELIEMCKVAANTKANTISHMRAKETSCRSVRETLWVGAGSENSGRGLSHARPPPEKLREDSTVLREFEKARWGLNIPPHVHYTAAGRDSMLVSRPWTEDGGYEALFKRTA